MNNLKADSVLFLTRDGATDLDRSAAKLFARCDVELRHVTSGKAERPSVDVLIHAKPDTIGEIKSCDYAGRLENAIRNTSSADVRHLQWVEEGRGGGPSSDSGIGDGAGGG